MQERSRDKCLPYGIYRDYKNDPYLWLMPFVAATDQMSTARYRECSTARGSKTDNPVMLPFKPMDLIKLTFVSCFCCRHR